MAQKLMDKGFSDVYALKGGWREWFRAKYPVDPR
jgi:rhodanese-related sulfurtransferase